MARDATARLYDVNDHELVFTKFRQSKKYDIGTIEFQAKEGKLVYLDRLHESIWATRLSGGTRSGVISLEVTAVGEVVEQEDQPVLEVQGTDREFVLVDDVQAKPEDAEESSFAELREALAAGKQVATVTGYVAGWSGRWPGVLRTSPAERPELMVTSFELAGENDGERKQQKD